MYQIRTYFGVKKLTQLKYIKQYKIILDIQHSLTILDHRLKNNTLPQQVINIHSYLGSTSIFLFGRRLMK